MTAPKPGTTMARIAELERQVKILTDRLDAIAGLPPKRDPASTTHASLTIRNQPDQPSRKAFGFGPWLVGHLDEDGGLD